MKNIDFNNPPASYIAAFNGWFRANMANLSQLHAEFLADTGATKYDKGCSYSEFCAGMFRETAAGKAALEACDNSRN